ncbi:unnamed protein product, partial [marine sediment metagenome]
MNGIDEFEKNLARIGLNHHHDDDSVLGNVQQQDQSQVSKIDATSSSSTSFSKHRDYITSNNIRAKLSKSVFKEKSQRRRKIISQQQKIIHQEKIQNLQQKAIDTLQLENDDIEDSTSSSSLYH